MTNVSRIHVIGVAGSGKTTLARLLGSRLDAPVHDLDYVYYDRGNGRERPREEIAADIEVICAQTAWVTEGTFVEGIEQLLSNADLIVWLDVPRFAVVWRLIKRHAVLTARRANPHPGLPKLIRFVRLVARQYGAARESKERAIEPHFDKAQRLTSGRSDRLLEIVASRALAFRPHDSRMQESDRSPRELPS